MDIEDQINLQKRTVKANRTYSFNVEKQSVFLKYAHSTITASRIKRAKKKKSRVKASLGGRKIPKTLTDILELDNNECTEWLEAIKAELDGLTEMGVLLHRQSMADLHSQGVTSKPVQLGLYFDEKINQLGEVIKKKVRAAVQGHRGNMQKGIHFHETYAATPQSEMDRILSCLAIKLNWKRKSWDISKAYCWAKIPKNERIALRYPKGYKEYDEVTGEELFMVLMKNLYGDPAAGRRWSIQRDDELLGEKFNRRTSAEEIKTFKLDSANMIIQFQSKRLLMDPCLFLLTVTIMDQDQNNQAVHTLIYSIHTDDIDAIGSTDEVLETFESVAGKIWELKRIDPNFMLRVQGRQARSNYTQNDSICNWRCTSV